MKVFVLKIADDEGDWRAGREVGEGLVGRG